MKAIILAAGRGSRMGGLTDDRPKCFVELQGKPLIIWQIEALRSAGIHDIAIVRGYKGECFSFTDVTYFTNERWSETNMVSTLACAADWLNEDTCIVSYSDIIYSPSIIESLIASEADIAITYDTEWLKLWQKRFDNPLSDAETFKLNPDGTLLEIGKRPDTLADIEGQYMGLLRFTTTGWRDVGRYLSTLNTDRLDMTSLLNALLEQGVGVSVVPIKGGWCEYDNEGDLSVFEPTWGGMRTTAISRYATLEEIQSAEYSEINSRLNLLCAEYGLTDHTDLNRQRYPWSHEFLTYPQFYASRLWEYPWAVTNAKLNSQMKCADIGCGESAFTIYLKKVAKCDVTGFDHDIGSKINETNFGVPSDFSRRTGIEFIESSIDAIRCDENTFDRVFCLSVIEHIQDFKIRSKGMQEIARILKPGGMAFVTVDVNLMSRLSNPLELVWESGLNLYGMVDLTMPEKRLGIYCDGLQPADVFGIALIKENKKILTSFDTKSKTVFSYQAANYRDTFNDVNIMDLIVSDLEKFKSYLLSRILVSIKLLLNRYPKPLK